MMKRILALSLAALLALSLMCGCQSTPAGTAPAPTAAPAGSGSAPQPAAPAAKPDALSPALLDDDILTYERLDPGKTTLILSTTGNIGIGSLVNAFMAKNPDVQIITLDITGGNEQTHPAEDWVRHGYAPDIMVFAGDFNAFSGSHLLYENLSANPVISRYQTEALNRIAIDNNVYALPGPSSIDCIVYNKTLFEQYGWEVPVTFDEFVALCDRIKADTNGTVDPWNPNAKYSNELLNAVEAFVYAELFGGVKNRTWYNEFLAGNAGFAEHLGPMYDMVQTLVDHGILRTEHFSYSATARWNEFLAGRIAMVNSNVYTQFQDSPYEFAFMPFPTTVGADTCLISRFDSSIGVPVRARTPEQEDALQRLLEFISSAEGQAAYIGSSLSISNVKGVEGSQSSYLEPLRPAAENGRLFTRSTFKAEGKAGNFNFYNDFKRMAAGELTPAEALAANDVEPYKPAEEAKEPAPEIVGSVKEEFNILQTSCFLADLYREAAGADVGLIAHNLAALGNLMRIFPGDLTASAVTVLKPRQFANGSTLVRAKMTGRQLLDALNRPLGQDQRVANCIYAFSGLRCTVAPWNAPGERYLSVTLADGTPLDESTVYTVAFWEGSVFPEYITEIAEHIPGTFEELMAKKLAAESPIAPADDGRITLVWD